VFKGQVLMSSAILRDKHSLQDDGSTLFSYSTPTLTIGGTKDGLMRITRIAESYYHQITNVTPAQAGLFPIDVLEGVSHYQFAGGEVPSFVQSNDLKADVADADARTMVGQSMSNFITSTLASGTGETKSNTDDYFAPLLEAMRLEGSYVMKPACYQSSLINVPTPTCLKGSPWVEEHALKTLVGNFTDPDVTLVCNDNFHRAATVYPYHHPDIDQTCADSTGPCTVNHISNTENAYDVLNELDLGKTPIASTDMRVKMKSSQSIHWAARESDADFEALDD
jgi:hypothetical protein